MSPSARIYYRDKKTVQICFLFCYIYAVLNETSLFANLDFAGPALNRDDVDPCPDLRSGSSGRQSRPAIILISRACFAHVFVTRLLLLLPRARESARFSRNKKFATSQNWPDNVLYTYRMFRIHRMLRASIFPFFIQMSLALQVKFYYKILIFFKNKIGYY